MNYVRVLLAGLGGFLIYFAIGSLGFVLLPGLKTEFKKYPAIYRGHESIMKVMPAGMAAMFFSILALAAMYALIYRPGYGVQQGALLGLLVAVFAAGAFTIHNYVNLNIGMAITVQQTIIYSAEWIAVCIVISLIYKA